MAKLRNYAATRAAAIRAMTVVCPNCNAQPGKPCTHPTDTGRRAVPWVHLAREDAAAHTAAHTARDTP